MIVAAAFKQGSVIFAAEMQDDGKPQLRHEHLLQVMSGLGLDSSAWEAGFMTSSGYFLNRSEAADYALQVGQITKLASAPDLYDIDVW